MSAASAKPAPSLKGVKLRDKTGVSRAYQIALSNPNIGTVAALQEVWIKFVEESIAQIEAQATISSSSPKETAERLKHIIEFSNGNVERIIHQVLEVASDLEGSVSPVVLHFPASCQICGRSTEFCAPLTICKRCKDSPKADELRAWQQVEFEKAQGGKPSVYDFGSREA